MGLAAMNALGGDFLGVGRVDPMTSMMMGIDPVTAMLMGQQGKTQGSCQARCGLPAPPKQVKSSNGGGMNAFTLALLASNRNVDLNEKDDAENRFVSIKKENATVAVEAEFTNDLNLDPESFDAAEVASLKENASKLEGEDRALFTSQNRQADCGCDAYCAQQGNCCQDYYQMCPYQSQMW
jgi:hypothetical protein